MWASQCCAGSSQEARVTLGEASALWGARSLTWRAQGAQLMISGCPEALPVILSRAAGAC